MTVTESILLEWKTSYLWLLICEYLKTIQRAHRPLCPCNCLLNSFVIFIQCLGFVFYSLAKTACYFLEWLRVVSFSSHSSCCVTFSLVSTCLSSFIMMDFSSCSWSYLPSVMGIWPVSACASVPSEKINKNTIVQIFKWENHFISFVL